MRLDAIPTEAPNDWKGVSNDDLDRLSLDPGGQGRAGARAAVGAHPCGRQRVECAGPSQSGSSQRPRDNGHENDNENDHENGHENDLSFPAINGYFRGEIK